MSCRFHPGDRAVAVLPHLVRRDTQRRTQAKIVLPPAGNVVIKQCLKRRRGPCPRMHPIGDGIDDIAGKHVLGYFSVFFRHAVHVVTEVERQVGHVEDTLATEHLWHGVKGFTITEHACH